ncbi:CRISPR-associated protein Cas4 [Candidatus Methylospira mobilis]|uniref:CRISPR-associated exonuclease Cas4 n=1 Tax=Candidatus Methylospira mobilis TaxID=1808979 RepID=A0A5Q0BE61_9GAMM|nr:CRISPR-associated protein Cas4 [Candidatus Methylospira mobilis]QFY42145.1 CRISPR-associated protein Cas4 [Candidatus Methylospira mobilis]WNV03159.1 CRISPR-associated protein Cas4 [Candidatus Methylospira mobilis]
MSDLAEVIPLSALNQYAYCPRRCYLIHAEGEFQDNIHTVRGTLEHERVDQQNGESKAAGVRLEYALPVWSDVLGISGRCDAVEFRPDGEIFPVEHKHGKRKQWSNDDLQLAAQAMCLEEMTGKDIPRGAIFHQQSRRRREVIFDDALRLAVKTAVEEVRAMLSRGVCPSPLGGSEARRCGECSLRGICEPELVGSGGELEQIALTLFDPKEEVL